MLFVSSRHMLPIDEGLEECGLRFELQPNKNRFTAVFTKWQESLTTLNFQGSFKALVW